MGTKRLLATGRIATCRHCHKRQTVVRRIEPAGVITTRKCGCGVFVNIVYRPGGGRR